MIPDSKPRNLLFWLLITVFGLFFSGCMLPKIKPGTVPEKALEPECRAPFVTTPYEFVHSIEAQMPVGGRGVMMGVTIVTPESNHLRCVIMTIEGMVLFEAEEGKNLVVNRAISPFDSPDFAKGLIADIRLLFFAPDGKYQTGGKFPDGAEGCRYENTDGTTQDVLHKSDGTWGIRKYSKRNKLVRRVDAGSPDPRWDKEKIPSRLVLKAEGVGGYRLQMDLIHARALGKAK